MLYLSNPTLMLFGQSQWVGCHPWLSLKRNDAVSACEVQLLGEKRLLGGA